MAVVVGVGVAQLRGVGPVGVLDGAGHDSCADPPQRVVAVGEVDPVRLAPLVFDGTDAMGVGLPVDVTLETTAFHFVDQMGIGQVGDRKGLAVTGHLVQSSRHRVVAVAVLKQVGALCS